MSDAQCAGRSGLLALPGKSLSAAPVLLLLVCLCYLPLVSAPFPVQAAAAGDQEAKLQQLRQRIQSVRQELAGMLGEQNAQQQALEKTEKEIGSVTAELRRLEESPVSM